MTSASVIKDSVNPAGQRITSAIWKYPRYIHSEIMTHRATSKNAASSRAIPIKKMLDMVMNDPVIPSRWGKNQPGMQSMEFLTPEQSEAATKNWLEGRDRMVDTCSKLDGENQVHKQWANRVLEPWMHITIIITATEWANLYNLRCHKDAHPDFQELAYRALAAHSRSQPEDLDWGMWHTPFGDKMPNFVDDDDRLRVSTARSARLSYLTFEGDMDTEKDFGIHERLKDSGHWSPFEHCAIAEDEKPEIFTEVTEFLVAEGQQCLVDALAPFVRRDQGNLRGWTPYRKRFPGENRGVLNADHLLANRPDWIQIDEL